MTTSLFAFALVAAVLTVTPGLDTMLVIRNTAAEGRWVGYSTGLGVCAGVLTWGIASAVGITAVLAASRVAFDVLRLAGAAYLFWLGLRALWRSRARVQMAAENRAPRAPQRAAESGAAPATPRTVPTPLAGFGRGLLTNLLNPKVGVFYITVLPQFIPRGAPALLLSVAMATVHACEGALWFALLVLLIGHLRQWVESPAVARVIERFSALVFIGFGVRLVAEQL